MSDEESFVILGTSPTPSMLTVNSLSLTDDPTIKENAVPSINGLVKINGITDSQLTKSSASTEAEFSVVQNGDAHLFAPAATNGTLESHQNVSISKMGKYLKEPLSHDAFNGNKSTNQSVASSASGEGSLAASFILGEVNSDVLKASVYSQFPSISMGACADDVVKLQNLMSEYVELKKTLMNTNLTMKQLYEQTQKWKQDVKAMEDDQKIEIAKLRNENLELRRDLENKIEQIHINEEIRRKEHEDFVRSLSEKSAQIENMSIQINKLEQQQLASFEFVPKNENETTQSNTATEYVPILEHQRIVKQFERQMSEIVAQNFDLKDIQNQYIDEINCLKVNLVAAEELQKKSIADINFLKAGDLERSGLFSKFEEERRALREDVDLMREQLNLYSRDFKVEQEARENLANEKDQLLSDLRELQKKNQDLIQEAQKDYEEHARQMATTGAFPKTRTTQRTTDSTSRSSSSSPGNSIYKSANFICPLCSKTFKTLSVLQTHVNQCLDGN